MSAKQAEPRDFFVPDICAAQPTLFLILVMELLVLVYVLASSPLAQFNWDLFAIASLLVQWQTLFSAWLICRCRQLLSRLSLPLATLATLGLVTLAVMLSAGFVQLLLNETLGVSRSPWWLLRNVLIANVLAGILLRYFYLQQQLRVRDQWALQARLDSLQARIRPHFLFNTLNSIASLIASRPEAAERAVEDLADLFRASLKENHGITTVSDEIQLTERYLAIEALRLGDRLQVAWGIDAAARDIPMPALVLQPLAENAVYHGIARIPAGGTIEIGIREQAGILTATIRNPLPRDASGAEGHHMALANVEQRLQAIYGLAASVRTSRSEGHFQTEIRYPAESAVT